MLYILLESDILVEVKRCKKHNVRSKFVLADFSLHLNQLPDRVLSLISSIANCQNTALSEGESKASKSLISLSVRYEKHFAWLD